MLVRCIIRRILARAFDTENRASRVNIFIIGGAARPNLLSFYHLGKSVPVRIDICCATVNQATQRELIEITEVVKEQCRNYSEW